MRKKIVDQICRGASPEHAARARAIVLGHGNLIDELIDVGFEPSAVLEICAAVTGIPTAPVNWLKSPKPPHVEIDTVLCRAVGAAPVASMAGRLCIAYADVEMAAQHSSLGLPPHQPYLALREQLDKALAMLPADEGAETRIATAETLQRPPRGAPAVDEAAGFEDVRTAVTDEPIASSPTAKAARAPSSDFDDPTEAVDSLSGFVEARSAKARTGKRTGARPPRREEVIDTGAADEPLGDDPTTALAIPAAAGTPLPPPRAPPPSAGMIGADEPWRRPLSKSDEGVPVVPVVSVPIAAVPPPSFARPEHSERTRRPETRPEVSGSTRRPPMSPGASGAMGAGAVEAAETAAPSERRRPAMQITPAVIPPLPGTTSLPAGVRPAESSLPSRRPETSGSSSASTMRPEHSERPELESSMPKPRGGGFSIERSRPMPAGPSLDPLVAPEGGSSGGLPSGLARSGLSSGGPSSGFAGSEPSGGTRRPPTRPFEALDPHVEPSNPTRRPSDSGASKKVKVESGPAKRASVTTSPELIAAAEAAASADAPAAARNARRVPIVVGVAVVVVVGAVAVMQGAGLQNDGTGAPPPLVPATAPTRPPGMDGKIVDDLPARQAELVRKGQGEADHKKAVALFDQAVRLSPNAIGSRTALLEKAGRLLLLGEPAMAQDTVMLLKRRNDTEPIEEQIEQLLDDIRDARQKK